MAPPASSVVYGLDYATAPERRATLERARDNDMIATLRDRLYQPKNGVRPVGVLVTVPIYAKGTSRTTVADRRRNVAGFIVAVFNLQPLLHARHRQRCVSTVTARPVW